MTFRFNGGFLRGPPFIFRLKAVAMINLKLQGKPWAKGARVDASYNRQFATAVQNLEVWLHGRPGHRRSRVALALLTQA